RLPTGKATSIINPTAMNYTREQLEAAYALGAALHLVEAEFNDAPAGRHKAQLWRIRAGNGLTNYLHELATPFSDENHED
ncbi:hypothetical protein, partial [Listeria monocytogenes]|uniref:hypothetical protein n=1 Tax=Listeria monocytogenes TaxID=1639 RepID=UPI002FDBF1D3